MAISDEWRIGDAERARATGILDEAWAVGKLTRDEHSERVEAALQAHTYGDLGRLLADLGATPESVSVCASHDNAGIVRLAPGSDTDHMTCILGDAVWASGRTMAKHTTVRAFMGDSCFDLTSMAWASDHITIDLTLVMGDAIILAPDGVRIEDWVSRVLGEVKIRGLAQPGRDAPVLTLRGVNILGDVVIYGPGSKKFAKYQKKWNR
ncbi:DUF1707 domain-containing protein [Cutibacterium sp.]|uniref:DUF1707 SHOCT-like domain-containing protein n=1 Tax=Cutibacterium sp. TaxID=1912221 RepID=UPI0026DD6FF1|nr:DUF1707 domain-containing protein [Cutibacterium sp.]MDO4412352.1 DUF1707 domain-containing protein [Cutibacterium sp.]